MDRDGLIDGNPVRLAAQAAPLRAELRDHAGLLINEWVETGLVQRYSIGGGLHVLFFRGFQLHQEGMEYARQPASRLPPPPGWIRSREGLVPENSELAFRLAESFRPQSKYRQALLAAASG